MRRFIKTVKLEKLTFLHSSQRNTNTQLKLAIAGKLNALSGH